MKASEVRWDVVFVTNGNFAGRIGYLDDKEGSRGIVYFGDMLLNASAAWIPLRSLRHATTDDLMRRRKEVCSLVGMGRQRLDPEEELDLLHELHYISGTLDSRWLYAIEQKGNGMRVFLSHSSKDQEQVRWIAVDLSNSGYRPWLDEWEISAGESIPRRVAEGIEDCTAVLVALSPRSVESR